MAGQVSLKSIAEACSLSVSTVSQILNDKPNNFSSEETKRRVREAARKARDLVRRKSAMSGLDLPGRGDILVGREMVRHDRAPVRVEDFFRPHA